MSTSSSGINTRSISTRKRRSMKNVSNYNYQNKLKRSDKTMMTQLFVRETRAHALPLVGATLWLPGLRCPHPEICRRQLSRFRSPIEYGTLIKRTPKRDPSLENYPELSQGRCQRGSQRIFKRLRGFRGQGFRIQMRDANASGGAPKHID